MVGDQYKLDIAFSEKLGTPGHRASGIGNRALGIGHRRPLEVFDRGGRWEFQPIAHNDTDDLSLENIG